ncbi:Protein SMAX1-LIKE 3 [Senna tora]|uniref:Protein SMAX1-LIKE 3 n=1 Tax=Senna tora TaxID=362788 RepID=A0A834WFC2_9FABA|nr:Protein SMAX1-LIKE 3 [Senna tora]
MRTGNCGVQQGLTAEAASVVKAAVSLAKRRGHAQVTPLHVANTMLSASNGLLRTACLQSHSHPLQCKALELCFNVALNRLPASNSSSPIPLLGPSPSHSHSPSISNALVAAFKRAQAHQRRGSIETQQQPLLALKIELEQLIISILDDPSVSRVMREAGFSSTQVKTNVEQAVSLDISNNPKDCVREEDVRSLVDYLRRTRRSTVVVGECVDSLEGVVRALMDKAERGEQLVHDLRDVKFIPFSLSAFEHLSRVEVEKRIEELTLRGSHHNGKGLVLYVGDLKWVFEYRSRHSSTHNQGRGYYCPVEHVMMEIGKLLTHGIAAADSSNAIRFWVIGIATFHTYTACQNGYPSLETLWALHPFTLPAGNLGLTLIAQSDVQKEWSKKKGENGTSWLLVEGREEEKQAHSFVGEPEGASAKFETQPPSLPTTTSSSNTTSSTLPAWLQHCKNDTKRLASNDQNCVPVGDVCKKWNNSIMCSSNNNNNVQNQPYPCAQQHSNYFWISGGGNNKSNEEEPTLRMYIPEHNHTTNNPNSISDVMETDHEEHYVSKFKEFNSENLKTLCHALQTKVPWQKHIIPDIATTVLQCRSGMFRRKGNINTSSSDILKEETWLLFQGVDMEGKEKIARELARLVFGSHTKVVSLGLSSTTFFSSTEHCRNKRSRDEQSCSYIERFAEAVSRNPHSVFLVEDINEADYCSQMGFKRAMQRGRVQHSSGQQVRLSDAIIILSCETLRFRSRPCSPSSSITNQKASSCDEQDQNMNGSLDLDLNICINDDSNHCEKDRSLHDNNGLLESVDRRIIFNFQEL